MGRDETVVVIAEGDLEASMDNFDTAVVMVDAAERAGMVSEEDRADVLARVFRALCRRKAEQ